MGIWLEHMGSKPPAPKMNWLPPFLVPMNTRSTYWTFIFRYCAHMCKLWPPSPANKRKETWMESLLSKWKVHSGHSTLHTKPKLETTSPPPCHPQEKTRRTLHSMLCLFISCMEILFLKLVVIIIWHGLPYNLFRFGISVPCNWHTLKILIRHLSFWFWEFRHIRNKFNNIVAILICDFVYFWLDWLKDLNAEMNWSWARI